MTRDEMDRVIEEHFQYEHVDDVDGVMSTMGADPEHDVVGFPGGPQRGRAAVRAFYEHLFADLHQEGYTPLRRYYGDDFIIDEVLYTGRLNGRIVGLDDAEGTATFRLLHILEFKDGRISRENIWQDVDAIRAQLGGEVASAAAPA